MYGLFTGNVRVWVYRVYHSSYNLPVPGCNFQDLLRRRSGV